MIIITLIMSCRIYCSITSLGSELLATGFANDECPANFDSIKSFYAGENYNIALHKLDADSFQKHWDFLQAQGPAKLYELIHDENHENHEDILKEKLSLRQIEDLIEELKNKQKESEENQEKNPMDIEEKSYKKLVNEIYEDITKRIDRLQNKNNVSNGLNKAFKDLNKAERTKYIKTKKSEISNLMKQKKSGNDYISSEKPNKKTSDLLNKAQERNNTKNPKRENSNKKRKQKSSNEIFKESRTFHPRNYSEKFDEIRNELATNIRELINLCKQAEYFDKALSKIHELNAKNKLPLSDADTNFLNIYQEKIHATKKELHGFVADCEAIKNDLINMIQIINSQNKHSSDYLYNLFDFENTAKKSNGIFANATFYDLIAFNKDAVLPKVVKTVFRNTMITVVYLSDDLGNESKKILKKLTKETKKLYRMNTNTVLNKEYEKKIDMTIQFFKHALTHVANDFRNMHDYALHVADIKAIIEREVNFKLYFYVWYNVKTKKITYDIGPFVGDFGDFGDVGDVGSIYGNDLAYRGHKN